jgi:hypothetical protein
MHETHVSSTGFLAQRGPVAAAEAIRPVSASFDQRTIRKPKRGQYRPLVLAALLGGLCQAGQAQAPQRTSPSTSSDGAVTLFQNVRVFDGKSSTLSGARNVNLQDLAARVRPGSTVISPRMEAI